MSIKKIEHPQENFERNERLIRAVDSLRLERAKIIEEVPCSRTLLSRVLNKKWPVSDRFLISFCDRFGVSREWLRDGTGPMRVKKEEKVKTQKIEITADQKGEPKNMEHRTAKESTEAGRFRAASPCRKDAFKFRFHNHKSFTEGLRSLWVSE